MTPTARALNECKKRGWVPTIVERWVAQARKRMDAFGFGDVLVMDDKPGALMLQVTSTGNAPSRCKKILEQRTDEAWAWLSRGNRLEVWGYAKRGAAGKRKLWALKRYSVELHQEESGVVDKQGNDTGDWFLGVRVVEE